MYKTPIWMKLIGGYKLHIIFDTFFPEDFQHPKECLHSLCRDKRRHIKMQISRKVGAPQRNNFRVQKGVRCGDGDFEHASSNMSTCRK